MKRPKNVKFENFTIFLQEVIADMLVRADIVTAIYYKESFQHVIMQTVNEVVAVISGKGDEGRNKMGG